MNTLTEEDINRLRANWDKAVQVNPAWAKYDINKITFRLNDKGRIEPVHLRDEGPQTAFQTSLGRTLAPAGAAALAGEIFANAVPAASVPAKVGKFAGGLATAIGTGMAADAAQEALLTAGMSDEEVSKRNLQNALTARQHPVLNTAGTVLGNFAYQKMFPEKKIIKEIGDVIKALKGGSKGAVARTLVQAPAVQSALTGAGIAGTISGVNQLRQGEFRPGELLTAMATSMGGTRPYVTKGAQNIVSKAKGFLAKEPTQAEAALTTPLESRDAADAEAIGRAIDESLQAEEAALNAKFTETAKPVTTASNPELATALSQIEQLRKEIDALKASASTPPPMEVVGATPAATGATDKPAAPKPLPTEVPPAEAKTPPVVEEVNTGDAARQAAFMADPGIRAAVEKFIAANNLSEGPPAPWATESGPVTRPAMGPEMPIDVNAVAPQTDPVLADAAESKVRQLRQGDPQLLANKGVPMLLDNTGNPFRHLLPASVEPEGPPQFEGPTIPEGVSLPLVEKVRKDKTASKGVDIKKVTESLGKAPASTSTKGAPAETPEPTSLKPKKVNIKEATANLGKTPAADDKATIVELGKQIKAALSYNLAKVPIQKLQALGQRVPSVVSTPEYQDAWKAAKLVAGDIPLEATTPGKRPVPTTVPGLKINAKRKPTAGTLNLPSPDEIHSFLIPARDLLLGTRVTR